MKDFVKRNFVLVLGISLPVLLVLVFSVARLLTQMIDPPQFKPVISLDNNARYYGTRDPFEFRVDSSGRLVAEFKVTPVENAVQKNYFFTRILVFDPETGSSEEFEITSPKEYEFEVSYPIVLPEKLAELNIIEGQAAPDGYTVKPRENSGGNLFTTLFGYNNSYNQRYVLEKDGRKFPITTSSPFYGNFTIIGWVKLENFSGD